MYLSFSSSFNTTCTLSRLLRISFLSLFFTFDVRITHSKHGSIGGSGNIECVRRSLDLCVCLKLRLLQSNTVYYTLYSVLSFVSRIASPSVPPKYDIVLKFSPDIKMKAEKKSDEKFLGTKKQAKLRYLVHTHQNYYDIGKSDAK